MAYCWLVSCTCLKHIHVVGLFVTHALVVFPHSQKAALLNWWLNIRKDKLILNSLVDVMMLEERAKPTLEIITQPCIS